MILIVGGAYQGKMAFAKEECNVGQEELLDGRECTLGSLSHGKGMHHFQDYVRRYLLESLDASRQVILELEENPDAIIISNELGCGLVPMDAFDRTYRETVGRLQCEIAKRAGKVYRVYCGIGVKIK